MRTLQKKNESTNFCCSSARYYKNSNCNDFFPTLTFPTRTSTNQYCSSARYYKNSFINGFFPPLLFPLAQRYLKNTHLQAILKKRETLTTHPHFTSKPTRNLQLLAHEELSTLNEYLPFDVKLST